MTSWSRSVERLCFQKKSRREFLVETPIVLYGFYMANKYLTKSFTFEELKCRGTGLCDMDPAFLEKLQLIRDEFGKPMYPSSGYRHPDHNEKVSTTGRHGPHTTGHAVDIAISGRDAIRLMAIAQKHGMTGIGVSQKGPHDKRFLHLDDLTGDNRPWIWSY